MRNAITPPPAAVGQATLVDLVGEIEHGALGVHTEGCGNGLGVGAIVSGPHAPRSATSREQAVGLHSIIEFLTEHLGARLLALTVGVDRRTVGPLAHRPRPDPQFGDGGRFVGRLPGVPGPPTAWCAGFRSGR